MIKSLLRLLATSTSAVAVLLAANVAMAAPNINLDSSSVATPNQSAVTKVNLNVVSSSLAFTQKSDNILLDHFGCSCAVCSQGESAIAREL